MKVKTFKIVGSKNLLTAIEEELSSLGFTINLSPLTVNPTYIASSMVICETIDEYKRLFWGNVKCKWNKTFELPQQYDEALAFAKEQLLDKYWIKTPQKWDVGTYAVCVIAGVNWSRNEVGDIYLMTGQNEATNVTKRHKGLSFSVPNLEYDKAFKWFATKKEAEEFAKTLKPNPTPKPKPVAKEVEPKFKIGDYVILAHNTHIGRITKINNTNYSYWGFRNSNLGFTENDEDIEYSFTSSTRLATPQEIEEFLIRVAKIKGFKEGVKYASAYDGTPDGEVKGMYGLDNSLNDKCGRYIYYADADRWATIIPESKPVEPRFTRTKKVEDLVYPDVVHCNSQEERDLLAKYWPDINYWNDTKPYMMVGKNCSGGYNANPYPEGGHRSYVNYEFSNIIFPEEFVLPDKWCIKDGQSTIVSDWLTKNTQTDCSNYTGETSKFIHYPAINGYHLYIDVMKGYTPITLEQFQKHVLREITLTKLPFGNLEFTIHKGDDHAHCSEGIVYKSEIQAIVDWFDKDFTLLGHKMKIKNEGKWFISFGCCDGTLQQAKAILKAFN